MRHRNPLRVLCAVVLVSGASLSILVAARASQHTGHANHAQCAKACAACATACRACSSHCSAMVRSGMKEHVKTKALSDDCGEICATAARICGRQGPLTAAICGACADACDACGAECGKYPTMKPMKDCAASTKVCAKACREMVQALKG